MISAPDSTRSIPPGVRHIAPLLRNAVIALALLVVASGCGAPEALRTGIGAGCDPAGRIEPQSGLREFRDCPHGPLMVELPPGRFLMGSPEGEEAAALHRTRPAWTETLDKPQVEVEIA